MRTRRIALGVSCACGTMVILAFALTSLAASAASKARSESSAVHASSMNFVNLAMAAAQQAGDANPTLIQHVAGTRKQLNAIASGDVVSGNAASYLIAIRGQFRQAIQAPYIPGATVNNPVVTASVITLVVDAATGQVTDSGMSNTYPDLAVAGSITTDFASAP